MDHQKYSHECSGTPEYELQKSGSLNSSIESPTVGPKAHARIVRTLRNGTKAKVAVDIMKGSYTVLTQPKVPGLREDLSTQNIQ